MRQCLNFGGRPSWSLEVPSFTKGAIKGERKHAMGGIRTIKPARQIRTFPGLVSDPSARKG
jgi:hypothetical protein